MDDTKEMKAGVAVYVKELDTPSVVSSSHHTLRALYSWFGQKAVDAELERVWAERKSQEGKA